MRWSRSNAAAPFRWWWHEFKAGFNEFVHTLYESVKDQGGTMTTREDLDRWVANGWIQGYTLPDGLTPEHEAKLIDDLFGLASPDEAEGSEVTINVVAEPKIRWCDFHGGGMWVDEDTIDKRVARFYFETDGTCGVDWYKVCPPCAAEQVRNGDAGRKWSHWTEVGKMDDFGNITEYFWVDDNDDRETRQPDIDRMKAELRNYLKDKT